MDLHNVRQSLKEVLKARHMSRRAFGRKHEIPQSWLNQFAQGVLNNPRHNSLKRLEEAIKSESGVTPDAVAARPTLATGRQFE